MIAKLPAYIYSYQSRERHHLVFYLTSRLNMYKPFSLPFNHLHATNVTVYFYFSILHIIPLILFAGAFFARPPHNRAILDEFSTDRSFFTLSSVSKGKLVREGIYP